MLTNTLCQHFSTDDRHIYNDKQFSCMTKQINNTNGGQVYKLCFLFLFMLKTFISLCAQQSSFTLTQNNIWYIVKNICYKLFLESIHTLFCQESHRVSCLISNITINIKL